MRDGNQAVRLFDLSFGYTTDPTYEGWKQLWKMRPVQNKPPTDPTYEGWKLHFSTFRLLSLQSTDPTYEGWKLTYPIASKIRQMLLPILPMRDGNQDFEGCYLYPYSNYRSYL